LILPCLHPPGHEPPALKRHSTDIGSFMRAYMDVAVTLQRRSELSTIVQGIVEWSPNVCVAEL
jgi:hypothetical protein